MSQSGSSRTHRVRRVSQLFGVSLLLAAATGCGKEKPTAGSNDNLPPPPNRPGVVAALASLCSGEAKPFTDARPYTKSADPKKPSKIAVFGKYLDEKDPSYRAHEPDDLKPFLAKDANVADVELVVCVDVKRNDPPSYCAFTDGSKQPVYGATHTLRVLEVQTGKELLKDELSIDRRAARCAGSLSSFVGKSKEFNTPDFGPMVAIKIASLEPEGVTLPPAEVRDLDDVCAGSPVPQAARYDPAAGRARKVHIVYYPSGDVSSSGYRPQGFPRVPPEERNNKDLSQYELVACVTANLKEKKKDCAFDSGNVLELHEGEFEVRLMEAHTAKLVETKTFKGSSPGACPVIHSFFAQREKEMLKIEPAFEKYLAKLQGPKP